MSLYRVKQFYWSLTSKVNSEDIKLINEYLNEDEKTLFYSLSTYEQKHSIKVTRDVIEECRVNKISDDKLIKASILHDIGKTFRSLNPVEKSIVVMLDSMSKGKLRKYSSIKTIDVYYNHGDKGYNLLKKKGNYDERFLYLIKNHHNDSIIGDKELDILRLCDSKN